MSTYIRIYNSNNEYYDDAYNISKLDLSISYMLDSVKCYYHEKQNDTLISEQIPDTITIDEINQKYAGKIPLINRLDLISSLKVNGVDYSSSIKDIETIKWSGDTYEDLKLEFEKIAYNKDSSGNIISYSDYVFTLPIDDASLHKEFDIEIQLKDNIDEINFLFYNTFITSSNGDFLNNRKNVINNAYGTFANCNYLTELNDNLFNNCVNLISIDSLCEGCVSLTKIGNSTFENCYKLYSTNNSFKQCSNLISVGNNAFKNCQSLTDISVLFLYSKKISSIGYSAFENCVSLTNIGGMFAGCTSLNNIGENLFKNCKSISTAVYLFSQCSSIHTIPGNIFTGCYHINNIFGLFSGCTSLEDIGDGLLNDMTNLANVPEMFEDCRSLKIVNADLFSNNKKILNFTHTFKNCKSITEIPIGLFDNNVDVTTFYGTFQGCSNLISIPSKLFENNKKVTAFSFTFSECNELSVSVPIDSDGTPIYNRSTPGKNGYSKVNYTTSCFKNCTKLKDYDNIPNEWK